MSAPNVGDSEAPARGVNGGVSYVKSLTLPSFPASLILLAESST